MTETYSVIPIMNPDNISQNTQQMQEYSVIVLERTLVFGGDVRCLA